VPIDLFIREACELVSESVAESVSTCRLCVGLDVCAATRRAAIQVSTATQSPRTKQLGQLCIRKTARANIRRNAIVLLADADHLEA
jgi:hypothetical protein